MIIGDVFKLSPQLLVDDETLNDSDKTFTVTAGKIWLVHWVHVEYSASADVGNRTFTIEILDSADDVIFTTVGYAKTITASQTPTLEFLTNGMTLAAGSNLYPLPLIVLEPGYKIRLADTAAIAAAADDMNVKIYGQEVDT